MRERAWGHKATYPAGSSLLTRVYRLYYNHATDLVHNHVLHNYKESTTVDSQEILNRSQNTHAQINYSERTCIQRNRRETDTIYKTSLQGTLLEVPKNYHPYSLNTLTTSKKRTTSLQRIKLVNLYCPQRVPCSGGSTVYK